MEIIKNKLFYYLHNGLFACEILIKKRWNGEFVVEIRDNEPAIFSKAMQKKFVDFAKAEAFFDKKIEQLI